MSKLWRFFINYITDPRVSEAALLQREVDEMPLSEQTKLWDVMNNAEKCHKENEL